jgi:tRNA A37 N6-isopentenylltransferase MiaA
VTSYLPEWAQELTFVLILGLPLLMGGLVLLFAALLFRRSMKNFDHHLTRLWNLHMELVSQLEAASHLDAWRARQAELRRRRAEELRLKKDKQGNQSKTGPNNDAS